MKVGTENLGNNNYKFTVWAPKPQKVSLKLISDNKIIPMEKDDRDYWSVKVDSLSPGIHYKYLLDDKSEFPDPASNFQPEGVHGPSQLINHDAFTWSDEEKDWTGIEKSNLIIYELHVGAFTPEGTFEAVVSKLDYLLDLGINTIEIMPIAQFPGERNWGYDGVYTYAPQNSYGTPDDLKKLVNECHKRGMAVCLDVVYNHFGPEGNYTANFGPYLTNKYKSPWGDAINFDDAYGTDVGNFFIENVIYWFENFHIDILRLDAIHSIYDMSANHILKEIARATKEYSEKKGRKFLLIAESDLNDSKILKPWEMGGYALDGQWSDDFHHSLRTLLTGEHYGYYADFGKLDHFKKALEEGYAYSELYSKHRKKIHGNSPKDVPADCFVTFCQNHDQVGNRMLGERLSHLVTFDKVKLAAAAYILSPYIPMIFMGEEYAESNPFLYFVSHSDKDLIEKVIQGRKDEFASFKYTEDPPNPIDEDTFKKSALNWESHEDDNHKIVLNWYKTLIKLRKTIPALAKPNKDNMSVYGFEDEKAIIMHRWEPESDSYICIVMNFNEEDIDLTCNNLPEGSPFVKLLDSSDRLWGGTGSNLPEQITNGKTLKVNSHSIVVYKKDGI